MIVLTILKWIGIVLGWTLLGILALALLILLLVLFVPFRYSAAVSNHEDDESGINYGFGITWILHAISVRKKIDSDVIVIKILGIPIKKIGGGESEPEYESEPDRYEYEDEDIFDEPEIELEEAEELPEEPPEIELEKATEFPNIREEVNEIHSDLFEFEDEPPEKKKKREKRKRISDSKEGPIERLFSAIRAKIEAIKLKIRTSIKKIGFIFYKLSSIIDIVKDKTSRRTVKRLIKEVVKMIRYVGPKKISGSLEFGTGDPASTGLILGGVSMCKLAYHKDVSITPNFDEKCLIGDAAVKGRVRVVYFVRMALRIWFDKDVHRLWKNYRRMKKDFKRKERALEKEGALQN